jgi:hypothetical protein
MVIFSKNIYIKDFVLHGPNRSIIEWLDHREKMQKIPTTTNSLYFKTSNPWQKKNYP